MILSLRGLDDLPVIEGDPRRLVQVFQNLISNAIKFTPDGGKIDINAMVLSKGDAGEANSIQIVVADSGIGIDRDSMQLIFEKFFRVGPVELHSTGATKFKGAGPGLGLPIAKGIVEGHGGRIWVESRGYDEVKLFGSVFTLVLPIHPPAKDLRSRIMELGSERATRSGRITDHFATRPGREG
jgi:signal transduction histidine kinase